MDILGHDLEAVETSATGHEIVSLAIRPRRGMCTDRTHLASAAWTSLDSRSSMPRSMIVPDVAKFARIRARYRF